MSSVESLQIERFRRMSPTQKLLLAAELRETNLELLAAGLRRKRGDVSPEALKLELFRLTLPERLFHAAYSER